MKIKKLAGTLLGVFVVATLTPFTVAHATSIDVSYSGSAIFNNQAAGYEIGWIAPQPNSAIGRANVYIGGDSLHTTTANSPIGGVFNAWCVDIYHWMTNSATYDIGIGTELATDLEKLRGNGTGRVNQLLQLADEVYSTLMTKKDNAAFQLAIWEITYGTADSSGVYKINETDSGFNVDHGTANSSFTDEANGWLAHLNNANVTGNYALTYLNDGTRENTQDLVVFTALPSISFSSQYSVPVPEPSSLVLLGLAGLGFLRRKA